MTSASDPNTFEQRLNSYEIVACMLLINDMLIV